MKKLILIWIIFVGCNNSTFRKIDITSFNIKVLNENNKTIQLNTFLNENNNSFIFFYNLYSCEKCYERKLDFIKQLDASGKLRIIGNFENRRQLQAFKQSFGYKNCFMIDNN